ncbi:MAG: glycosyltransferase family 2 protein [Oscillospiraceae bacterium]|nr:glycosyltransferase family 2 protein [Oscillospiraceae bacterium]
MELKEIINKYNSNFFDSWDLPYDSLAKWKNVKSVLVAGSENKQNTPLLSVCIPTYKGRAKVLREAIDSILKQKVDFEYEIIISDNYTVGDNETEALMNEYCTKYNNIFYYRTDFDFGMYPNWNRAVELCNSELIVLLNNDDVMNDGCLKRLYETAKKTNSALVASFKGTIVQLDGVDGSYINNLSKAQKILQALRNNKSFHLKPDDVLRNIIPTTGCMLFKKSTFIQYGGFNPDYEIADCMFYIKMMKNETVQIIPDFLFSKRIQSNGFLNYDAQLNVIGIIYGFGNYYINQYHKNSKFKKLILDISVAYMVYGIKSKYNQNIDCKTTLEQFGVRKSIANMHPKLLTLLNCVLLTDLIFRK